MSKTFNKEKIRCPRDFFEKTKGICVEKNHQIQTESIKNTKNSKIIEIFMQFLCTFRKTWWLRILETFNQGHIVREAFVKK